MSKLNIFADCMIPETPCLVHSVPRSVPLPLTSKNGTKCSTDILSSLISASKSGHPRCRSVSDFYNSYKSGQVTPLDVAHVVLSSIEESNKGDRALRAITFSNREIVLAMAKASTERWKSGSQLSILDGVPVSINEGICVDSYPCQWGTTFIPAFAKHTKEDKVATNLIQAGALIIGLTNMPEFGTNSIGSSENHLHKQPRNPHNLDFFPGGSSSGGAVSVAAGLCPLSIGGDGGGSGRVPAAVCGVYALKFTQGLAPVSDVGHSLYSFAVKSPMANSPLDIAVFMDIVCEEKSVFDFSALNNPVVSLSGVTIGVYMDWVLHAADTDTVAAFQDSLKKLKMLGATVKEIKIPELEELRVAHSITAITELSAALCEDVEKHFGDLGPSALLIAAMGNHFSATESVNAMKQRTRMIKALKHIFTEVDLIATPTAGCPIVRVTAEYLTSYGAVDAETVCKLEFFTFLASFTGIPAVSIPVGTLNDELKLPSSLQLMARWYHDLELIKYATVIEASKLFSRPIPSVAYDLINQ